MIIQEREREREREERERYVSGGEDKRLKIWYEINAVELEKNKNGQLYVHPNI